MLLTAIAQIGDYRLGRAQVIKHSSENWNCHRESIVPLEDEDEKTDQEENRKKPRVCGKRSAKWRIDENNNNIELSVIAAGESP